MIIAKQAIKVFSFSVSTNSVNLNKNYYQILEVDFHSDQKLIKKNYLKLVKTLHPDINPNGKQKFTEVREAYEVLSDNQLKKYYDQNNLWKITGGQKKEAAMGGTYNYSTHEKQSAGGYTAQSTSGHSYYTHRSYASENPQDYFYTDNEPKSHQKSKNSYQKQEDDSKDNPYTKKSNFNKEQKYARSKSAWEQYQKHKKQEEQKSYSHDTPEEKRLRDKLKAMRGFTSSYNVLWGRHHIRPDDILGREEQERKKEEEIKNLMPQKIRKFYDRIMNTLEEHAKK